MGAIGYGLTYQQVFPKISAIANVGSTALPDLFHVNHWLVIILFTQITLMLFYVLGKTGDLRGQTAE
ncbi:MAG: hypothetical protein ACE5F6_08855 [Anaerolineae bacterium]